MLRVLIASDITLKVEIAMGKTLVALILRVMIEQVLISEALIAVATTRKELIGMGLTQKVLMN